VIFVRAEQVAKLADTLKQSHDYFVLEIHPENSALMLVTIWNGMDYRKVTI